MIELRVPYAEKDDAKILGARWSAERRTWYVPDGMLATPFECWLPDGCPGGSARSEFGGKGLTAPAGKNRRVRVDSYIGKTIVGAHYFQLDHACSPFMECAECQAVLVESGWEEARRSAMALATQSGA